MLDMFAKPKVEISETHAPQPDQTPGLEDAWRVLHAINKALQAAEFERMSLAGRVEEATARAAVTLGNGNDEYLERESLDTLHLNLFDAEIRNGNEYVARLDQNIALFKRLKASMLKAFPEISKAVASS